MTPEDWKKAADYLRGVAKAMNDTMSNQPEELCAECGRLRGSAIHDMECGPDVHPFVRPASPVKEEMMPEQDTRQNSVRRW